MARAARRELMGVLPFRSLALQPVPANPKAPDFNSDVDSNADSTTGGTTLPGSISGSTRSNQKPFGTCGYAPAARSRRIHSRTYGGQ
jgi:hypothetical protein